MSTAVHYLHLTIDGDGTARIEKTRYKVIHLAGEHYHYGWSAEEILRQHPDLRPEQVHAALTYFYDHHDQFVQEMQASAEGAPSGAPSAAAVSRHTPEPAIAGESLTMPLSVYMDVHIPIAITDGLRRRNIDVLTSQEDGSSEMDDEPLLARATELGRLLFTHDQDFLTIAAH